MADEFLYTTLPTPGAKHRGEDARETINRELGELVAAGWEPVSITSNAPTMMVGFLLKRPAAS